MPCTRGCCESQLEHYRSVSIAASACPSRKGGRVAKFHNDREKQWSKDFPAVRQMAKDGIVPKSSTGAAEMLARASTRTEIESGKILNKRQRTQLEVLTGKDVV